MFPIKIYVYIFFYNVKKKLLFSNENKINNQNRF